MKRNLILPTILATAILFGCEGKPKVITSSDGSNGAAQAPASGPVMPFPNAGNQSFTSDLHAVVVQEVLPTDRYVYLRVTEGEEEFWIATRKMDIEPGGTWYYRDGLLKTNFESKEYNRVFEKVYLVSSLVPADHGGNGEGGADPVQVETHGPGEAGTLSAGKSVDREGSMKIADVVKKASSLEGKTIQVSGVCTKINPGIMGRNWIHLVDGSKDDYDFVVTSDEYVPEGAVVTFNAVVGINRDFGAGYTYALILENGEVVK